MIKFEVFTVNVKDILYELSISNDIIDKESTKRIKKIIEHWFTQIGVVVSYTIDGDKNNFNIKVCNYNYITPISVEVIKCESNVKIRVYTYCDEYDIREVK